VKVIHHVFDVDTPVATLWNALTTAEGLAGWWSTRVSTPSAGVGQRVHFTFGGDFNPVMEITHLERDRELHWRCVEGHPNWQDNSFRFQLERLADDRVKLRFWQDYAVELDDDYYGVYNFNWGYYLESLRTFCETGVGKPYQPATG
jgi:uncharacterized protein YndB with AHSA1/START domain